LYPLLQGYDSAALDSDITIVGSDQLFNELMGRFYKERFGHAPQVVITTRITPGIDGGEKQNKSLGNYIALDDTPRDKYGKAMSLPDNLVRQFLEFYTLVDLAEIAELDKAMTAGEMNPMIAKKVLAQALVERYHGPEAATEEQAWFEEVFSKRSIPEDIPVPVEKPTVLDILRACLPNESLSELRRLIDNGAVKLDGKTKITEGSVLRIGKRRWFRISFKPKE
ncbi:MAG: tyrosine--tRNA ligase, partial [Candidatus Dormibacteraceae bacterium]